MKSPFLANPLGRTRVVENGTGVEILTLDFGFSIFSFSAFSILDPITVLTDRTGARCTNVTRIAFVKFLVAKKSVETAKNYSQKLILVNSEKSSKFG